MVVDTRNCFLFICNENRTSFLTSSHSIVIRLYSNGAFQNLPIKPSLVGFVIGFCDVEKEL